MIPHLELNGIQRGFEGEPLFSAWTLRCAGHPADGATTTLPPEPTEADKARAIETLTARITTNHFRSILAA